MLQEAGCGLILVCILRADQFKVLLLCEPLDANICRGIFDRSVEALRDITAIGTEAFEFCFLKIGLWLVWL